MNYIHSKENKLIKDLIRIRDDSKFRNDKSLFYIEGLRLFNDAPRDIIDKIFIKSSEYTKLEHTIDKFDENKIYVLDDYIYEYVKDTNNSQGIIAIANYKILTQLDSNFLININNIIILDGVRDPGNLGTIIRVAEAANVQLIILCNNCCNVYNPKVIRASMSSIFRVNIYISNDILYDITNLKNNGFSISGTVLDDKASVYYKYNFTNRNVIVFGNEANGISDDLKKVLSNLITIPMRGKIESLNVAVSVSIILYEIVRQKANYETKS